MPAAPDTPSHIAPYVRALGTEAALRLILELGGTDIYLPRRSSKTSKAALLVGAEGVEKLAGEIDADYVKVPLARQWAARQLRAQGLGTAEIARAVRADTSTVRRWLNGPDPRQVEMFPEIPRNGPSAQARG